MLVRKRDVAKAVRILAKAFPKLEINDTPVVTRFVDPATDKVVLDVMKPTQGVSEGGFSVHACRSAKRTAIPDLEMALVTKVRGHDFAVSVGLTRRLIDAGDFMNVVMNNRERHRPGQTAATCGESLSRRRR